MKRTASRLRATALLLAFFLLSMIATAQTTWYVDGSRADDNGAGTSWATAKKYVQSGINLASAGDAVWVAQGTYKPTTGMDRNASFVLGNGVLLFGGFVGTETSIGQRDEIRHLSILSGDLQGNDAGDAALTGNGENSFRVVTFEQSSGSAHLDGFTIKGGTGYLPGGGGGLYFYGRNITVTGCIFRDNSPGDEYGGALSFVILDVTGNSTVKITNCVFYNNQSNQDIGSVLYTVSQGNYVPLVQFANCVFAKNNGSMFRNDDPTHVNHTLTNCTIAGNTVFAAGAGDFYLQYGDFDLRGCAYSVDNGNGNATGTFSNSDNRFSFSCRYSAANIGGRGNSANALDFQNSSNAVGPDGLWRTADDGLRPLCSSSAINLNDATATGLPTIDITGNPRTALPDAGAYEAASSTASQNTIPTATTSTYATQSGTVHYSNCTSEVLALTSSGAAPVSGGVIARVFVDSAQAAQYVKRHYEIDPASNFATATGTITLYFTQSEFDDFNAVNGNDLPTGSGDATGIANLRIEQRTGQAAYSTGQPSSYPTGTYPAVTITPTSVTFNATASRWEVTFNSTGFGGYFVKTLQTVLPLRWMNVSGRLESNKTATITWKVSEESVAHYQVSKSANGVSFAPISTKVGSRSNGINTYSFHENVPLVGKAYYRVQQTDLDGKFSYSPVLPLTVATLSAVTASPNPTTGKMTLTVGASLLHTIASLLDGGGKLVKILTISNATFILDLSPFAAGAYLLQLADGTSLKLVKE